MVARGRRGRPASRYSERGDDATPVGAQADGTGVVGSTIMVASAGAAAARRWTAAQGASRPRAIAVLAEADLEEEERDEADPAERHQRQGEGLAGDTVPDDREDAAEDHRDCG